MRPEDSVSETVMTRRSFAAMLGAASGSLLLGAGLSSCGNGASAAGASPSLVSIAAPEATTSLGLDPRTVGFGVSMLVSNQLYAPLVQLAGDTYAWVVAESAGHNADATVWTLKLRPGLTFHNGKPITAADALFSLKAMASAPSNRTTTFSSIRLDAMKAVDATTLEIPLNAARGDFVEDVLSVFSPVFPAGQTTFTQPVGSGRYKFAGVDRERVRLTAVKQGSWPDQLEVIRMDDASARLSAVRAGQIQYAVGVTASGAQTLAGDSRVKVRETGAANGYALSFAMNQTQPPFTDPRVRQAVRLAADRKKMVAVALQGKGAVGNDLVGLDLPGYLDAPQRTQDLARARSLFAAAGVTALTLRVSELVPGFLAAANLLQQNLASAGVHLTMQNVPADQYYADLAALPHHPFQAFYYENRPAALNLSQSTVPASPFNVTGQGAAHAQRLAAAQAIVDDAKRLAAFNAIQQTFYDTGGDLIWGFTENIDIAAPTLATVALRHSVPEFGA